MAPVSLWQKIFAGVLVILTIGVWIFFQVSLKGFKGGREYFTILQQSVRGLSVNSLVSYNGIIIGKVTAIKNLFEKNGVRVDFLITDPDAKIFEDTPNQKGTRASVVMYYVTGIQYIELSGGGNTKHLMNSGEIKSKKGKIEEFIEKIYQNISEDTFKDIAGIVSDVRKITRTTQHNIFDKTNPNSTLVKTDKLLNKLNKMMENVNELTGTENKEEVTKILKDTKQITLQLRQITKKLEEKTGTLMEKSNTLLANLNLITSEKNAYGMISLLKKINNLFIASKSDISKLLSNLAGFSKILKYGTKNTMGKISYFIEKDLRSTTTELKKTLKEIRQIMKILKAKPNALLWGEGVRNQ